MPPLSHLVRTEPTPNCSHPRFRVKNLACGNGCVIACSAAKKQPAETADQPAPPPLQPAYFEADQAPGSGPEAEHVETQTVQSQESRPTHETMAESDNESAAEQPAPQQSSTGSSAQAGRSRRRRGGRGRGGRGREQAVAQAFAPAAVKGSIPVLARRCLGRRNRRRSLRLRTRRSGASPATHRRLFHAFTNPRSRAASAQRRRCSRDRPARLR